MNAMHGSVRNLEELRQSKKELLNLEAGYKEKLEQHFLFIRSNYRQIVWNSINPFRDKGSIRETILTVAKQTLLPSITGLNSIELENKNDEEIIGLVLMKLIERFKRKKKRDKKSTEKI